MKKIIYSFGALLVVIFLFLLWYRTTFSMGVATSFELNDPKLEKRVLIATQDSRFKNAVVENVVNQLNAMPVYIRVIDVSELDREDAAIWTAIVVLHTWEMGKPQENARKFIQRAGRPDIIVLATSGDGNNHIAGVDGLTSASKIEDVRRCADDLVSRISARIK